MSVAGLEESNTMRKSSIRRLKEQKSIDSTHSLNLEKMNTMNSI